MEQIEMAEKLQQKANVSLEEAKAVLESCSWDMLDAMILLEKEGKVKTCAAHGSTAHEEPVCTGGGHAESADEPKTKSGKSGWNRSVAFIKGLLRKGMDNRFVVRRKDSVIIDLPVLIAVSLMIVFFWLTIILLVIGLFTHCEYSFTGADLGKDSINDSIRKATDAVQNLADQVTGSKSEQ